VNMLEALLLGLSTGPSCMLYCGPVAVPLFLSHLNPARENSLNLLRFMAGRLIGYLAAGFILGLSGTLLLSYLPPRIKDRFMLVSYILAGTLMLLRALALFPLKQGQCRSAGRWIPEKAGFLLTGLATGLNLCPPFLAMASRVLDGPLKGMFSFFLFFLGTSVYLLALLLFPLLRKHRESLSAIGRITLLMMGIYFIFFLGILDLGRWV